MAESKCVLVFHRHREARQSGEKTLLFAAEKLRPLLEQAVSEGKRVHVIHERIHTSGFEPLVHTFETMIKNRKFMRGFKEIDRQARARAKAEFERADRGISTPEISENGSPEERLILEFNRRRPKTAVNYMNFYPIEALVGTWRAMVHVERAKQAGSTRDSEGVVRERINANYAFREAFLLRDSDLVRQVRDLLDANPEDIVFTARGMGHRYMVKLFADKGIQPLIHVSEDIPSFNEQAMEALLTTGLSAEAHERLILLDMLFNTILKGMEDKHSLENRRIAREQAIERFKNYSCSS